MNESWKRQAESSNEGGDAGPVYAVGVVVSTRPGGGEHLADVQVTAADEEVVDCHDGDETALEDGVAAQEAQEAVCGGHDAPIKLAAIILNR